MRRAAMVTVVLALTFAPTPASAAMSDLGPSAGKATTLAVIGDTPYDDAQFAAFPGLVAPINADRDVRAVVHLGDMKSGQRARTTSFAAGSRCLTRSPIRSSSPRETTTGPTATARSSARSFPRSAWRPCAESSIRIPTARSAGSLRSRCARSLATGGSRSTSRTSCGRGRARCSRRSTSSAPTTTSALVRRRRDPRAARAADDGARPPCHRHARVGGADVRAGAPHSRTRGRDRDAGQHVAAQARAECRRVGLRHDRADHPSPRAQSAWARCCCCRATRTSTSPTGR